MWWGPNKIIHVEGAAPWLTDRKCSIQSAAKIILPGLRAHRAGGHFLTGLCIYSTCAYRAWHTVNKNIVTSSPATNNVWGVVLRSCRARNYHHHYRLPPGHFTHIKRWMIKTIDIFCAVLLCNIFIFLKLATLGPCFYLPTGWTKIGNVLFRKGLCSSVCQTSMTCLAPRALILQPLTYTVSFNPCTNSEVSWCFMDEKTEEQRDLSNFSASELNTGLWVF